MKKIAELDKQIDHDQHELLNASELSKTDGPILNLASADLFSFAII
jgi:peptidoglycan pentaglycine glycine transferase (the fourth and fifth glycine)